MLQRGHSGDACVSSRGAQSTELVSLYIGYWTLNNYYYYYYGCDLASTLCKYDLRYGDLFVLSWARVRRVRQHGYKTQHYTMMALHTVNNTIAKGFNQMAPPARTITVALDMSKAFDTINIHTLIRNLLQTRIPGTIIKFIVNYIKGRKVYTTYRNNTSSQRQFKTGVPQGGVLSPKPFNIYTADIPPPRAPVQVMAYADDLTITSTHTSTSAAKKYL